MTKNGR